MDVVLGVVLGMVLAASLAAGWRFVSAPRRVLEPGGAAMQRAVHAATAILPHLRRGLTTESAESAAPALLVLTGADAVALAGPGPLLDVHAVLAARGHERVERVARVMARGAIDRE